jgi:hypothetical protein
MSMSLFPRPPGAAQELPPRGSILYNQLRAAQPNLSPVDQNPDSDDSDQTTTDLAALGLPISKSGTPFFPPPPQPSIVPPSLTRSWLDIEPRSSKHRRLLHQADPAAAAFSVHSGENS